MLLERVVSVRRVTTRPTYNMKTHEVEIHGEASYYVAPPLAQPAYQIHDDG